MLPQNKKDKFIKFLQENDHYYPLCFFFRIRDRVELFVFTLPKFSASTRDLYAEYILPLRKYIALFRYERDRLISKLELPSSLTIRMLPQPYPDETPILPTPQKQTVVGRFGSITFTSRQVDYLKLHCRGMTMAEVGDELGVSARTVETTLDNVRGATGYFERAELIKYIEPQLL